MVIETALAQSGRLSIVNSFVCHCVFCLLSRHIVFIRGLIYTLGKTVWIAPRADHKEKTETSVVLPNDQYAHVF